MEHAVTNTKERPVGTFRSASPDIGQFGAGAPAPRILIAGGDGASVQPLRMRLAEIGFSVQFDTVENARAAIARESPHLVVLDWDLSSVVAIDLLRHIRGRSIHTRIIALSTFAGEEDVLSGFQLGVDDYVIKPFSIAEVVARARAILRPMRAAGSDREYLEFRAIRLYRREQRVTIGDSPLPLRQMEFRLLEFLMLHPERAFSRQTLLERVWGPARCIDLRVINVTVQRIRRALVPHGCQDYLQGVRSLGYRLSASSPR